jgi:hypothetical protein
MLAPIKGLPRSCRFWKKLSRSSDFVLVGLLFSLVVSGLVTSNPFVTRLVVAILLVLALDTIALADPPASRLPCNWKKDAALRSARPARQEVIETISGVLDEVVRRMNAPDSSIQGMGPVNEVNGHFEDLMRASPDRAWPELRFPAHEREILRCAQDDHAFF